MWHKPRPTGCTMTSGEAVLMTERLERVSLRLMPDCNTLAGIHVGQPHNNHRCRMSDSSKSGYFVSYLQSDCSKREPICFQLCLCHTEFSGCASWCVTVTWFRLWLWPAPQLLLWLEESSVLGCNNKRSAESCPFFLLQSAIVQRNGGGGKKKT